MTCDALSVPAFRRDTSPKGRGKAPSALSKINDNFSFIAQTARRFFRRAVMIVYSWSKGLSSRLMRNRLKSSPAPIMIRP